MCLSIYIFMTLISEVTDCVSDAINISFYITIKYCALIRMHCIKHVLVLHVYREYC